ncbi:MAG TPA: penicillin-binding transpeptidase domain-containing protein [Terracidiphilus sp.]|nr:penicillin-binding transpeptidase domain-containing protein [Terracidiphilus sp.]
MQAALRATRPLTVTQRATPMKLARFWLVCGFFFFWAVAIAARLFWLQVIRHSDYLERADKQQQRTFEVAPRRGILYDRNMHELAMTVQVESVYAVPSEIDDQKGAARVLAAIVHTDSEDRLTREDQIAHRLDEGRSFAWIARRVTPEIATKIRGLNMKGIYFQNEFQRFYPDNQIAAQVLGYVGVDDNGLGGLEGKFNGALHGVPGHMFTAMDARRRVLGSVAHEPEPGQNLQLTIDENIQFMAEKALNHAMEKTNADNGTIVVQDVHTGQILALAIRPTFNPNDFRHTTTALLKDHAVSDVYEPGSVFKLVTYASALDSNVTKPDDMIDCQGGQIKMAGGRIIHDNQGEHLGVVTVHKALEESSDVAAVKLALKIGPDRFYQYMRDFGFGSRSGVEVPGETRGLLRPTSKWNGSSIGSLAIGQEVGVTPVQLVSMVSTIANGGTYLPPRVLMPDQLTHNAKPAALEAAAFRPGEDMPNPLPSGAHRVISEMAAAQMRKMMEGVVLFGTGKPAQLNGYSSGGKTGTAQKVDPVTHLYSKTMHIASFAGIAPVNNPVIAVAVVIDNPRSGPSYYGTAVSAPVFAEVAQEVLEYLNVPHDIDVRPAKTTLQQAKAEKPVEEDDSDADQAEVNALFAAANDLPADDPLRQQTPAAPVQTAAAQPDEFAPAGATSQPTASNQPAASPSSPPQDRVSTYVSVSDGKKLSVPSLVGLPIRSVIEMIAAEGLQVEITGSGTVREQAPAAGTQVPSGTKIIVRCGR